MYEFWRFSLFFCFSFIFLIEFNNCLLSNDIRIISEKSPPDHKQYVAMARYVVHQADWASLATISNVPKIKGYPFTSIASISDGTDEQSMGIPYFYLTPLDFSTIDLTKDNRCTMSVTMEETSFCRERQYDTEDPRCARVMISGRMIRLRNGTEEYDFAKNALFTRHPFFKVFPKSHEFFVTKMTLENIALFDWFGGAVDIDIEKYLAYNDTKSLT